MARRLVTLYAQSNTPTNGYTHAHMRTYCTYMYMSYTTSRVFIDPYRTVHNHIVTVQLQRIKGFLFLDYCKHRDRLPPVLRFSLTCSHDLCFAATYGNASLSRHLNLMVVTHIDAHSTEHIFNLEKLLMADLLMDRTHCTMRALLMSIHREFAQLY